MAYSHPWKDQLTSVDSVADTTMRHQETGTLYVFSGNFTRLTVVLPQAQNDTPARTLVENLGQNVRPLCYAENSDGLDGHNHGIVCWKVDKTPKKAAFVLVIIWVLSGSLKKEERVLFTSDTLYKGRTPLDQSSVRSFLDEIQSVHFVEDNKYMLDTEKSVHLLTVEPQAGGRASILPLFMSSIPLNGVLDDTNKHSLRFITLRATSKPGVYLILLYYPLSQKENSETSLVMDAHGQVIAVEVSVSATEDSAIFTRAEGMVAAPLHPHTFTHDTALEAEEVNGTYVIAFAERTTLAISELHTAPPHAHVNDVSSSPVHATPGIVVWRGVVDNVIPKTLCIYTSRRHGWGFGPGENKYEVVVKNQEYAFRVVGGDGKFVTGQSPLRPS